MAVVEGVEEPSRLGVAREELPVEPAGLVELLVAPRLAAAVLTPTPIRRAVIEASA